MQSRIKTYTTDSPDTIAEKMLQSRQMIKVELRVLMGVIHKDNAETLIKSEPIIVIEYDK